MKHASKYLSLIPIIGLLALPLGCGTTGATSPFLTPAAVQQEIALGAEADLLLSPKTEPDVALGRDVICSLVAATNVSPESVSTGLKNAGITNAVSVGIINGAVGVATFAISLAGTNVNAQPYFVAICGGLNQALGSTPAQRQSAARNHGRMSRVYAPHS